MNVEICRDAALWDAFVEAAPEASNYHRWIWKDVIEETYGHKGYYLAARSGSAIQGLLPLVLMKSRFFGNFLVSMPFFSHGGVLAQDPEARSRLLAAAVELARELGVRHVEMRQGENLSTDLWLETAAKVSMEVVCPASVEELSSRLSPRLRNKIRYAQKHGMTAEWGGLEAVETFYPIFATNMRNLGTPVYPRAWFENIFRRAEAGAELLTIRQEGKPVASAVLIPFRQTFEMPWCASLPESRKYYSHEFMYWNLMEQGLRKGFSRIDLGRCTRGSGVYRFKHHWICEERPLHWYYWLKEGASIPQLRPDNPRYDLLIRLWKRLPLFVANGLGPRIVRSIP